MTDYKTWTDTDLAAARDAIATEIERRALLAQADQLAADLAARIAAASGKGLDTAGQTVGSGRVGGGGGKNA